MKLVSSILSGVILIRTRTLGYEDFVPETSYLKGNSARSEDIANSNCKEYCVLYAQALERCPSYFYQEGELDDEKGCFPRCVQANFAKDDNELSFDTDSLQCRMNHARMAIKEGEITNAKHCLHATIASPGECTQDAEAITQQTRSRLGKLIFYHPSVYLIEGNALGLTTFEALVLSISYLIEARGRLSVAYPSLVNDESNIACTETRFRAADGSCNSISHPSMGKIGMPFARHLKESSPHPNGYPDVAAVAQIMKRDSAHDRTAPFNQLATGWIQFMTHDWFAHDDQNQNKVTHWWDASQLYGSTQAQVNSLRISGGKLLLDADGELDYDAEGKPKTGFSDNFWAGLHVFHTIFIREHNRIVDILSSEYSGKLNDDELYGTARNIVAAILAKIHTIEWTPTLLDNQASTIGLDTNWYGLEKVVQTFFGSSTLPPKVEAIVGSLRVPSVMHNEYTTDQTMFETPWAITEEFVSAYRMHPLLPDHMDVQGKNLSLQELAFKDARTLVTPAKHTTQTFLKAMASSPAMTLSLKNYPMSLFDLDVGESKRINLAEIDITRDRERGLPRYNDARRGLLLQPYSSIDDLTDDEDERAALKSVYTDIEQVDLMVGCLVDKERPEGFAFGVVPYFIFVVMASRRLFSDRFYQEGLTVESYTEWGISYVQTVTFHDILIKHFPDVDVPSNPFLLGWNTDNSLTADT